MEHTEKLDYKLALDRWELKLLLGWTVQGLISTERYSDDYKRIKYLQTKILEELRDAN